MSLTPFMDSGSPQDPTKSEGGAAGTNSGRGFRAFWILIAAVLLIGIGEGIYAVVLSNRLKSVEEQMQAQLAQQDQNLQQLRERLGATEEEFEGLHMDLSSTKENLGKTQMDLRRARQMADQIAKEQKETAAQLSGQLGQLQEAQISTSGTVGSLTSEVTGVKQEVSTTKQDLASTRSELQRVIGDLGVQSGLVARNREELAELRLRGEREYYEFDLRKTNQPQKFNGGIALQLKKTDPKRQKYTIDLIADDRRIEKKDKTTNEPVQFYQQGKRVPTEIVVNQIYKDRIVGYIAVPKQTTARVSSAGTGPEVGAPPAGSGS